MNLVIPLRQAKRSSFFFSFISHSLQFEFVEVPVPIQSQRESPAKFRPNNSTSIGIQRKGKSQCDPLHRSANVTVVCSPKDPPLQLKNLLRRFPKGTPN
ncbi:unnamed protein product [Arabidopsis halleri]